MLLQHQLTGGGAGWTAHRRVAEVLVVEQRLVVPVDLHVCTRMPSNDARWGSHAALAAACKEVGQRVEVLRVGRGMPICSCEWRSLTHLVGAHREGERVEAGVAHGVSTNECVCFALRGSEAL